MAQQSSGKNAQASAGGTSDQRGDRKQKEGRAKQTRMEQGGGGGSKSGGGGTKKGGKKE